MRRVEDVLLGADCEGRLVRVKGIVFGICRKFIMVGVESRLGVWAGGNENNFFRIDLCFVVVFGFYLVY